MTEIARNRKGKSMRRKIIFLITALAILASAQPVMTQPAEKMHRIGFLHPGNFADQSRTPHFIQGLRDLGYVEAPRRRQR